MEESKEQEKAQKPPAASAGVSDGSPPPPPQAFASPALPPMLPPPILPVLTPALQALRNLLSTLTIEDFEREVARERMRRLYDHPDAAAATPPGKRARQSAASSKRAKRSTQTARSRPADALQRPQPAAENAGNKRSRVAPPANMPIWPIVFGPNGPIVMRPNFAVLPVLANHQQREVMSGVGTAKMTPEERSNFQWMELYNQLKEYVQRFGNPHVPRNYEPNTTLSRWVRTQRADWRRQIDGKPSSLTPDCIQLLVKIGLGNTETGPFKIFDRTKILQNWEARFQELVEFKNVHGHCNVSRSKHKDTHLQLATWVSCQRAAFQNRQGKGGNKSNGNLIMSDEQVTKLASIGFRFKIRDDFDERFAQLVEYKSIYGDTRVPVAFEGYNKLGRWVTHIKGMIADNKIEPARLAKLNAIDFDASLRCQGAKGRTTTQDSHHVEI